jgi:hypothetical protein
MFRVCFGLCFQCCWESRLCCCFLGWLAIVDVCCVLAQSFVLVLGCFVNVIVIVCFSKVVCSFRVVFQCCQESQFEQDCVFVLGYVFNVVGNQGCVVVFWLACQC